MEVEAHALHELGEGFVSQYGLRFQYVGFWVEVDQPHMLSRQHREIAEVSWQTMSELSPKNTSKDALLLLDQWQQR